MHYFIVKGEADPCPYYLVFLELDKAPDDKNNISLEKVRLFEVVLRLWKIGNKSLL